jgi:hypothetical protein
MQRQKIHVEKIHVEKFHGQKFRQKFHGRKMLLTVLAAALMVVVVADAAAQPALAPTTPPSTQGMTTRPQAPVGHRQPRMSDLPPDVAQRERSLPPAQPDEQGPGRQIDRSIDDSLHICKGC